MCRFGILEIFCYLYVTIDGRAIPDATRSTLQPGLERCFLMDAMPDIEAMTRKKEVPLSEDRTQDPEPL